MDCIAFISELTETQKSIWEYLDGPTTGIGVEEWLLNTETEEEAYFCNDQGYLTVELDGEVIFKGEYEEDDE